MVAPAPLSTQAAQPKQGAKLELVALRRAFGAYKALDGIDLAIEPGEFIALLGPSGCGKSTALNCIAGLLPLTGGEIRVGGQRIDQLEPEKRGFGMVFQSYALFPHMTVRRNVGFGLSMQGIKGTEADRRIEAALDLVRLGSQADKLPGQLSGGQQQRVAIARAIVIRPPVVLMDEPLSNLDAKLRLEMRADIRAIHDQIGSTTIYVTHDQDEALSMADRIVVMSQGHIRQIGTPEDLYMRPNHVDVADFMGFRTRIAGRITAVSGDESQIEAAGATTVGTPRQPVQVGDAAVLSVRPEDMIAVQDGSGIPVTIKSMEYRGRAYFGAAEASDGAEVHFRSDILLPRGTVTSVRPAEGRALIFKGDA
ncbi:MULTISPECIES: ABC transporter ATP-binding protein [Rhizobium/Agrobacterium group]|uniref:ABC transporter nucleotide binding/ATPase protein (Sn-Glycerol-3-phosphate) n=2 Tax=Rhizobium/Agrobacterium group TaxID=227290 RepID=B9K172_ALLAM|nr:ABC transporter ATP-binding protein [Allorhizobium ampelinum]MUO26681.1 ATP-binding cassette domain-containing protein [Agrobacterium vitis]ACM38620.1 ABC transporter nucleotide binding/ATPase protein (sn-Glycerol-3-phosphate) [Allorhizobium ampelinum S4]MCF1445788.1 ABC transporter ATP-binding protein [Allorhizobium ampelinum]MCF1491220.1 ABC transporter ATP-binding protein [Allorhizobium ampelinum]MUO41794.1 ATP-binding cassette domain-containing protein [Agrobacterium vitis]